MVSDDERALAEGLIAKSKEANIGTDKQAIVEASTALKDILGKFLQKSAEVKESTKQENEMDKGKRPEVDDMQAGQDSVVDADFTEVK